MAGDPLRALAALAVVLLHAAYQPDGLKAAYGDVFARLFTVMPVAVSVFFVLSGYLIARPFVRAYLAADPLPSLRGYLVRRALRILPAYWATVTVLLWLYGAQGESGWGILAAYGLQQSVLELPIRLLFPQTWSIAVEIGFYLFVPVAALVCVALARVVGPRRRLALLGMLLAAAWLVSVALHHVVSEQLRVTLPVLFWGFVPGIALAALEQTRARDWASRPGARALPAALVALSVASFALLMALGIGPFASTSVAPIVCATVGSAALVAAPLVRQWSGRSCWRWLDNRPLHWIGARSYSLYLIHFTVILQLQPKVWGAASGWSALGSMMLLALPASLLLSHSLYELVERPFQQRRLPWRRAPRYAGATS